MHPLCLCLGCGMHIKHHTIYHCGYYDLRFSGVPKFVRWCRKQDSFVWAVIVLQYYILILCTVTALIFAGHEFHEKVSNS